ncbi:CpsD [Vibrio parahaemolyticus AQ3810]|nr:CpsD [Vibrio parahaemolyticus AQ3810]
MTQNAATWLTNNSQKLEERLKHIKQIRATSVKPLACLA